MQRRDVVKRQIKEKQISFCFGGKKMFGKQYRLDENGYKSHEKWYHEFVKRRDSGMYYLGCGEETCGNQLLQLHVAEDGFEMVLLKDKPFRESNENTNKQILLNGVKFEYMQNELASAIENHQPITYRMTKREKKWYLTAMFFMDKEIQTGKGNGVFGMDYNHGFLEIAETNGSGNLVFGERIILEHHGTGSKAESELKEKLSKRVRQAHDAGKDIVVEDLDFKEKKGKTIKGSGKAYNKMIHRFDYHRYLFWTENLCMKYGVGFQKVNPAYTSQIGKQKYAGTRKLTVHRAAALVIARRGQGYQDSLTA